VATSPAVPGPAGKGARLLRGACAPTSACLPCAAGGCAPAAPSVAVRALQEGACMSWPCRELEGGYGGGAERLGRARTVAGQHRLQQATQRARCALNSCAHAAHYIPARFAGE